MPVTKERLLAAVKRYARARKGKLSCDGFCRYAYPHRSAIPRFFPGGFYSLLKAAGLAHRVSRRMYIPSDELLADYHRVAVLLKRRPRWTDLTRHARFTKHVIRRRFETIPTLIAAYEDWKSRQLDPLPTTASRRALLCATDRGSSAIGGDRSSASRKNPAHPHEDFAHGQPLSFRGLLCAPTNELGVLHLFGLLHAELGFSIVSIRKRFPDCLALRPSPTTPDHWDPVRIEFEFKASNFLLHRHDHTKCDLIVCWLNDWPDAPVPILELKTELRRIQRRLHTPSNLLSPY